MDAPAPTYYELKCKISELEALHVGCQSLVVEVQRVAMEAEVLRRENAILRSQNIALRMELISERTLVAELIEMIEDDGDKDELNG